MRAMCPLICNARAASAFFGCLRWLPFLPPGPADLYAAHLWGSRRGNNAPIPRRTNPPPPPTSNPLVIPKKWAGWRVSRERQFSPRETHERETTRLGSLYPQLGGYGFFGAAGPPVPHRRKGQDRAQKLAPYLWIRRRNFRPLFRWRWLFLIDPDFSRRPPNADYIYRQFVENERARFSSFSRGGVADGARRLPPSCSILIYLPNIRRVIRNFAIFASHFLRYVARDMSMYRIKRLTKHAEIRTFRYGATSTSYLGKYAGVNFARNWRLISRRERERGHSQYHPKATPDRTTRRSKMGPAAPVWARVTQRGEIRLPGTLIVSESRHRPIPHHPTAARPLGRPRLLGAPRRFVMRNVSAYSGILYGRFVILRRQPD